MAQRLVTPFVNTVTPGAYVNTTVKSTPVGLGLTGIIAVIGEAEGGAAFSSESLKDNFFSPDQVAQVVEKYVSGPIVDAMRALSAPSADAGIQGSVSRVYILKTNSGEKASADVDTDYGVLRAKNWGTDGNKIRYQITASQLESAPEVTGTAVAALANPGATAEVTDITLPAGSDISTGQHFLLDSASDSYYVWFNVDAGGGDPAPAGRIGIEVAISSADANTAVATATQLAINAEADFAATVLGAMVTVTNVDNGEASDAENVDVGGAFAITVSQQGGLFDASALNGASFSLRINGGAAAVVTLGSDESEHDTIAELIAELNSLLPSGISAEAGTATNTIKLVVDADSANYRKGFGKTLQLIDSTPGDLGLLGLSAGTYESSAESEIEVSISRADIGLSETLVVAGEIAIEIGYLGTTGSLSISGNQLTTSVTGGSGANLSVDLSAFSTCAALAEFLASQPGYSASATPEATQLSPLAIDKVSGMGIASSIAGEKPGRIKRSLENFKRAIAQSQAVDFSADEVEGLPSPMSLGDFLSGGLRGATTGANYLDALTALEGVQTNFVVPLFSRDASEDIADAETDSGSTYTISAILVATKSHVLKMSTPKLKRNRILIGGIQSDYATAKSQAQTLASFRCSLAFQRVSQVNSQGEVQEFQPWYAACVAAGMQGAGFYKGITNKFANVISYVDPQGFDSGSPGDVEQALESGLLILQAETAGTKWVSDQTTYGLDNNFVYNSLQAVYAADIVSLDLADSFQRAFVGQSLADVDQTSALAFLSNKMDGYRRLKLITTSDDAALGYKNAKIEISGPTMSVGVEIKLSTTIYFIPIELEISQVQSSAAQ
jgi:hypothetical protein